MQKKPTILNQQIVASSNLFKVEQLQLRFNNVRNELTNA